MSTYVTILTLIGIPAIAQNHLDLLNIGSKDLTGTARSVAMGGAFGALGGDAGGVLINPAGIGIYSKSEFSATLNLHNTQNTTDIAGGYREKMKKFSGAFSSLSYTASLPLNSQAAPLLNLGFSYNRMKSFRQKYRMDAGTQQVSLTDYLAYKSNGYSVTDMARMYSGSYFIGLGNVPWLNAMAYNAYLISEDPVQTATYGDQIYVSSIPAGTGISPFLEVDDKGRVDRYDFTIGTTINNKLSLGLNLSVATADYSTFSSYEEGYRKDNNNYGFELRNRLDLEATGFQATLGLIYKPINALRLGLSYQTPTWYSVTEYYTAGINFRIPIVESGLEDIKVGSNNIGTNEYEYRMRTPDRWTLSAATVIDKYAIISVDYEITNYKNMKLSTQYDDINSSFDNTNQYLKSDFKAAGMLRLGAEARITPRFSARMGYAWQQSPITANVKNGNVEIIPGGTQPHYILPKETNHFTYGFGYKFTKAIYGDIAFIIQSRKANLYAFSPVFDSSGTAVVTPFVSELKTNRTTGLFTIGVRF